MKQELEAQEQNKTWIVTDLPLGSKAIGSRWVYKIKRRAVGGIDRYKARLVAKGYHQVQGIDFTESFSLVAKAITVRVLLAMATAREWPVYLVDINNAYLYGTLEEDGYMYPPQGYQKARPGQVCKLIRSLYGLKQDGRQWNLELSGKLQQLGYSQSYANYCLYVQNNIGSFTALLIYVDDLLIIGNNQKEIKKIKGELHGFLQSRILDMPTIFWIQKL